MSDSFIERFVAAFEARPEKLAMRIVGDERHVYTFGQSLAAVRAIASRLSLAGIGDGDRVALIGENHPFWAMAYLGILYRGAVCVPLDPHGEIETIANFLENSEAKLAFLSSEVTERFGEIEERLGRLQTVVWSASEPATGFLSVPPAVAGGLTRPNGMPEAADTRLQAPATAGGTDSFAEWIASEVPADYFTNRPKPSGDDIALLIYTSGTTGTPKGVPLTHGNIVAELDGINEVLKLSDTEKILSLLPLFHAYLQIVNLWVATTYGCEVGYLKELSPAELGTAMKEFKPTILTTVPRLWYLFHKKIFDAVAAQPSPVRALFRIMLAANGISRDMFGINLGKRFFGKVHDSFGGRLRLAVSGGSRFDEDVAIDFHRLGFTILQGYGLTETSGAATATYEADNRVGSVGKPMKGTEIRIADPDGEGVGEILIKGDVVFRGYYRNPEATADAFTDDGWFRSGDLGKLDKDGHLYIVGRAKDVIVLPSGKNVHPEDIEAHYLKTPLVEELAIIGIRDESEKRSGAEKLAAVVVPDFEYLRQAKIANSKEAIRYALDNLGRDLPEYQRVRDYVIRAEPLPRTATRKIKRFELKKALENGGANRGGKPAKEWAFSAEDKTLVQTPAAITVVNAIRQNVHDVGEIHPSMNLEIDLGLDSLARAETFAALEQAFSTEFDGDEVAQALTVRDVIELVRVTPSGVKLDGELTPEGVTLTTELNWSKIVRETNDLPEMHEALRDRPVFTAFAFTVYKLFNLFCRVFMRLEVTGLEELRKMKRPFLICPNHQSFFDPFVVCSNYPYDFFRNTFHVGASMFFQSRFMRFAARMLQVVPVDPDTQLMKAMKAGAIGLKKGKVLNIYPEGERAYDGELHQFKKGAAILATELDLPIVPVAIDGLHKVWARRTRRIRPGKVRVRFGKAFYPREILSEPPASAGGSMLQTSDARYEKVTQHLRQTIATMIDDMRK